MPRLFLLVLVSDESPAMNRCMISCSLCKGPCVVAGAPGTRPVRNRANQSHLPVRQHLDRQAI